MLKQLAALFGAALITSAGLALPANADPPADQQVIVRLRSSASLTAAVNDFTDDGGDVAKRYKKVFNGFAGSVSSDQVQALKDDPAVLAVVPDLPIHALDAQADPAWGLDRIDQRAGPPDSRYTYDTTGAGVTAFVVDSGVRASHVDFGGRVVGGYDFVDNDADPSDCDGHGTHVAGTIGGSTYGVAKAVTIVPVRVLDCKGTGSGSDALAGFEWVIAHKPVGPSVLNFSVGSGDINLAIDAGAQAVVDAGISFVASAGNSSDDACDASPGHLPAVNTVGASDINDEAAYFSDYGDCIDLFAPGVDVTSAWFDSDTATNTISGTSMATPHVVGAIARYLQANPTATPADASTFINTQATPHAVTYAYSVNDNLLFVEAVAPPTPPAPPAPAPAPAPAPVPAPAPAPAPPVAPAPVPPVNKTIHVTKVTYNATGADTKRNVNGEWVRITNTGTRAVSLTKFRLRDKRGYVYTFPATTLGAKKSIVVHTGKGRNTSTVRFWGKTRHVWSNLGQESVTLRDARNRVVSTHAWRSGRAGSITWR